VTGRCRLRQPAHGRIAPRGRATRIKDCAARRARGPPRSGLESMFASEARKLQIREVGAIGSMKALTVKEASDRLGCKIGFIYKAVQRKEIPAIRYGTRVLIDEDDLPGIIAHFKVLPTYWSNRPERRHGAAV